MTIQRVASSADDLIGESRARALMRAAETLARIGREYPSAVHLVATIEHELCSLGQSLNQEQRASERARARTERTK